MPGQFHAALTAFLRTTPHLHVLETQLVPGSHGNWMRSQATRVARAASNHQNVARGSMRGSAAIQLTPATTHTNVWSVTDLTQAISAHARQPLGTAPAHLVASQDKVNHVAIDVRPQHSADLAGNWIFAC